MLIYTIYAVNSEIIEICVSTSVTKPTKPLHHILCLYLMHNLLLFQLKNKIYLLHILINM